MTSCPSLTCVPPDFGPEWFQLVCWSCWHIWHCCCHSLTLFCRRFLRSYFTQYLSFTNTPHLLLLHSINVSRPVLSVIQVNTQVSVAIYCFQSPQPSWIFFKLEKMESDRQSSWQITQGSPGWRTVVWKSIFPFVICQFLSIFVTLRFQIVTQILDINDPSKNQTHTAVWKDNFF